MSSLQHVKSGHVRALGVTNLKRSCAAAVASASSEEFATYISAEMKKWATLVKDAGIKPE